METPAAKLYESPPFSRNFADSSNTVGDKLSAGTPLLESSAAGPIEYAFLELKTEIIAGSSSLPGVIVAVEPLESRTLLSAVTPDQAASERLTRADVERILARAGSQALPTQIIAVVDREGNVLGALGASKQAQDVNTHVPAAPPGETPVPERNLLFAITRARTAAFFESTQDAFTTRTARFIIQDHFPPAVPNTPGGPLYGVQFSSLPSSDVFSGPAISGDPGGIPLFKNGVPVGGIGVAGDEHDIAARKDLLFLSPVRFNPTRAVFNGTEESDVDEQVALAGAAKFMAPPDIRATQIFLDGLRLPFTADQPASGKPLRTLSELIAGGASLRVPNQAGVNMYRGKPDIRGGQTTLPGHGDEYPAATFAGVIGQLKNPAMPGFQIRESTEKDKNRNLLPASKRLLISDVERVISDAVGRAINTRAAIRQPIGVPARVNVAVVDRHGNILGVFGMQDGTNFSFDVAVQKARTAAYFSDNAHAFSTRAIGFLSQTFFPVGIDDGGVGPLREVQAQLSLPVDKNGNFILNSAGTALINLHGPLGDGITIFPGGVPLYKNGKLVGAVGVSGDGVDQDDIISYSGAKHYPAPAGSRSDQLAGAEVASYLLSRSNDLFSQFYFTAHQRDRLIQSLEQLQTTNLDNVQLPYVKFPRDPDV